MHKISPRSPRNKHRSAIKEQILVFIVSFVSIYTISLFIGMRSKSSHSLDHFTQTPWGFIFILLAVSLTINLIYYFYSRSKILIVSVGFDEQGQQLILETIRNYSAEVFSHSIPYKRLNYSVKKHSAFFLGYDYTVISIYDEMRITGTLNTAENWDGEGIAIRDVIEELKKAAKKRA